MANTPRRDTPFEMQVRRILHARGFRYRVDRSIPGVTRSRPDIVFPTERVAVYLDGCFWHSCPAHGTMPASGQEWWAAKLRTNTERDLRHRGELEAAGWLAARFWEHEDPSSVADEIKALVAARRSAL